MTDPAYIFLYVANPERSTEFYTRLLKREPVEASPTFALFALESGVMLGLWSKQTVKPGTECAGGGGELAIAVESREGVDSMFARWNAQGIAMAQAPTDMEFGYTFVALDPDKHRLRVFVRRGD